MTVTRHNKKRRNLEILTRGRGGGQAVFDGSYFTYRLSQETSWRWASASWVYVVVAISIVRHLSPPFGKLEAARQALEGRFRRSVLSLSFASH